MSSSQLLQSSVKHNIEQFIYRECPNCCENKPIHLFDLTLERFISINPIYNQSWIKTLGLNKDTKFKFVKCSCCNFVYSQHRLNDLLQDDFYNYGIDHSLSLNKVFTIEKRLHHVSIWHKLLCLLKKRTKSNTKLKVLDFGAGWGDFLLTIKSPGVDVFGLEVDNCKIDFAKLHGVTLGNFDYIKQHAPYDLFMCDQVLEHLDNPRDSLRALRNVLKKDAIGYIGVPNFNWGRLNSCIEKIHRGEMFTKDINPWAHLNYFTSDSLCKMLSDSGFIKISNDSTSITNIKLTDIKKKIFNKNEQSTAFYVKAIE